MFSVNVLKLEIISEKKNSISIQIICFLELLRKSEMAGDNQFSDTKQKSDRLKKKKQLLKYQVKIGPKYKLFVYWFRIIGLSIIECEFPLLVHLKKEA